MCVFDWEWTKDGIIARVYFLMIINMRVSCCVCVCVVFKKGETERQKKKKKDYNTLQ